MPTSLRAFVSLSVLAVITALLVAPATGSAQAKVDAPALYKARCLLCHGATGDAKAKNASFADGVWVHGSSVAEISKVIRDGVKGTAMLPFKSKLNDAEVDALAKHVRAFDKSLK